ncbi:MAG: hypothetical protein RIQ79_210 [Verrucomicrobiota bacterium]
MKYIALLACLLTLTLPHQTIAADAVASSLDSTAPSAPVKLGITCDLVKDFPLALTASTTEDEMRFTFGPKPDGQYCTLELRVLRLREGGVKITALFSEETKVIQTDGTCAVRNIGFSDLSTVLAPGEEDVLFSVGEKKFTIKLLKIKK